MIHPHRTAKPVATIPLRADNDWTAHSYIEKEDGVRVADRVAAVLAPESGKGRAPAVRRGGTRRRHDDFRAGVANPMRFHAGDNHRWRLRREYSPFSLTLFDDGRKRWRDCAPMFAPITIAVQSRRSVFERVVP